MAKVLIVEDDLVLAEGLAAIIKEINPKIESTVTGYAREALKHAANNNYGAFLLDIQLLDGSGLDLAKKLREMEQYKLTPLVFITAIPTRELLAFKEVHCYDYIIKPFSTQEVRKVLETIIHYGIKEKSKAILKLQQRDYTYLIEQADIIFIEVANRRIHITTRKEKIKLAGYTLEGLAAELDDDFIRCHRSFIVNSKHIEKIDKSAQNIFLQGLSNPVPVGRKFKEYLQERGLWN